MALSNEERKIYVESQGYKLLEIIKDKDKLTKIKVECPNLHIYITSWKGFRSGSRCSQCANDNKKLKHEDVKYYIEVESNSGCKLISDTYINNITNLKVQCKCGNYYDVSFVCFKYHNQQQCQECGNSIKGQYCKLDFIYVKNFIESIIGYKLLSSEYINNSTKLTIKCTKGHIFEMSFADFQQGGRCGECNGHFMQKDTIYFKQEVFELLKDEYVVLGEYQGAQKQTLIKHKICGHEWLITPDNFLRGRRCPVCAKSKGEQAIKYWLEENNIGFISEYDKFIDLLSDKGNPLRFDFIVFKDKGKLKIKMLIEYDGIQHYKWQKGWQTKESFKTLQYHDELKNQYCKNNNIKLLRIPYWDYENIEEILIRELMINNEQVI